jgi:hypothetical protein
MIFLSFILFYSSGTAYPGRGSPGLRDSAAGNTKAVPSYVPNTALKANAQASPSHLQKQAGKVIMALWCR